MWASNLRQANRKGGVPPGKPHTSLCMLNTLQPIHVSTSPRTTLNGLRGESSTTEFEFLGL